MKKRVKKLVLTKETVRELGTLNEVGGGTDTVSACVSFCNSACRICFREPFEEA